VWIAYFNSLEARGTQQLQAITGLSVDGSDISPCEEVEVPRVEISAASFEVGCMAK
jgi:hypothetical protein